MKGKQQQDFRVEKYIRYGIRKYSFGAASVAIAAGLMFLGNGAVSASETAVNGNVPGVAVVSPNAEENGATAKVETAKEVKAEETKPEVATPKVEESKKEDAPKSAEAVTKEEVAPKLDKSQLESYVNEVAGKLAAGKYANKTDESLTLLNADLEAAKAALSSATSQDELKAAYNKLVTTVNSKLKNKPVEKKETPAVDTTNGKETVGKKAENTEKKSDSNAIENTGSKDERNGKEIEKGSNLRSANEGYTYSSTELRKKNGEFATATGKSYYELDGNSTYRIYVHGYQSENTEQPEAVNSVAGKNGRTDIPLSREEAQKLGEEAELWKGKLRPTGSTIVGTLDQNAQYGSNGAYEFLATEIYGYTYEQGNHYIYVTDVKKRFSLSDAATAAGYKITNIELTNLIPGAAYNEKADTIEGYVSSSIQNGVYDMRYKVTVSKPDGTTQVMDFQNLRSGWMGWQDTTAPLIQGSSKLVTIGDEVSHDIKYVDNDAMTRDDATNYTVNGERVIAGAKTVNKGIYNATFTAKDGSTLTTMNGPRPVTAHTTVNGTYAKNGEKTTINDVIPGLDYTPQTGLITGTATESGIFTAAVLAKDYNNATIAGNSNQWNMNGQEAHENITIAVAPKITVKNVEAYATTVPVTISKGANTAEITMPDGTVTKLVVKDGNWTVAAGTTNAAVQEGAVLAAASTSGDSTINLAVTPESTKYVGVDSIAAKATTDRVHANLQREVYTVKGVNNKEYTATFNSATGKYNLPTEDAYQLVDNGNGTSTLTERRVYTDVKANGDIDYIVYEFTRTWSATSNAANLVDKIAEIREKGKVTEVGDVTRTVTNVPKMQVANAQGTIVTVNYDSVSKQWTASDGSTVTATESNAGWKLETTSGFKGYVSYREASSTDVASIQNAKPTGTSTSYSESKGTSVNLIKSTKANVAFADTIDDKTSVTDSDTIKTKVTATAPDGTVTTFDGAQAEETAYIQAQRTAAEKSQLAANAIKDAHTVANELANLQELLDRQTSIEEDAKKALDNLKLRSISPTAQALAEEKLERVREYKASLQAELEKAKTKLDTLKTTETTSRDEAVAAEKAVETARTALKTAAEANLARANAYVLSQKGRYKVTARAVDSNGVVTTPTVDGTESGEVTEDAVAETTYYIVVTDPEKSSGAQGQKQTDSIADNFNDGKEGTTVSDFKLVDPTTGNKVASVTTKEGTYTVDSTTGEVSFTPAEGFVGTATPIKVSANVTFNDESGNPVTVATENTYTPTVYGVQPSKDETTGKQGQTQTSKSGKDRFSELNTATNTLDGTNVDWITAAYSLEGANEKGKVVVEGEGTYSIDPTTGVVRFEPLPTFTGEGKGVNVQVSVTATDSEGNKVPVTSKGKYTPTVTPVTPTAAPSTSTGVQGEIQKGTPTFTEGNTEVPIKENSVKLLNADGTEANGPVDALDEKGNKVGEYTVNPATGEVTFKPTDKSYTGPVQAAKVQAEDKNGTKVSTTYTPNIVGVTPTATPDESAGVQGETQEGTVSFAPGETTIGGEKKSVPIKANSAKLLNADGTEANGPVDALDENGKKVGEYTIDPATNKVTFTPTDKTYVGKVQPAKVQAEDENGTKVSTTYTPTIVGVTPTSTPATTTDVQGKTQESTVSFEAGKTTIDGKEKSVKIDPDTYTLLDEDGKPAKEVPAKDPEGNVIGKYTLKTVDGKAVAVFEPTDKTYSGDVQPVRVQAKDKNGTAVETTYTPKITPVTPTAEAAKSEAIQGDTQKGTPSFVPGDNIAPIKENSYKLLDKEGNEVPAGQTTPAYAEDGVTPVGTYSIDPATGEVTFTPTDKSYTGKVTPANVQAEDTNGTKVSTTYTPSIIPAQPEAEPAKTVNVQGATQTGKPEFQGGTAMVNGEEKTVEMDDTVPAKLVDPKTGDKVDSLTVEGEGTYTVAPDGTVTFKPEPKFTGVAKGVEVVRQDKNGTPAKATYTPEVKPVTPTGTGAVTEDVQGSTQTGKPEFKGGTVTIDGKEKTVEINEDKPAKLVDPKTGNPVDSVTIEGEGTYTVAPDGTVTFTPAKNFTGKGTGVTVQREDKNGTPVTAKYTPVVKPATPTSSDVITTNVQGAIQEGTPTFEGGKVTVNGKEKTVEIDETVKPTFDDGTTEKKVPGEGTYTIDENGKVTFTPEKTFTGQATGVTVKRVDKNGTPITAKYTPVVVPVTPTSKDSESEGPKGQTQSGTPTFEGGKVTINGKEVPVEIDETVKPTFDDGTTEKKVPGEGTYTIDENGKVTFTPEPDFVGKAKGVTVKRVDKNGTPVTAKYTPTVHPDTSHVDKDGNPLSPTEDGTKPSKDIPGYKVVKTEIDEKGNTKHIYEKVTTTHKDKDGNVIPGTTTEEGTTPKKDIPGYRFVETKKLPNGDIEHVYEKVKTSHKDKDGNEIPNYPTEDGEQPKKDIPGYRFVETKKLPNGDTEHVYEKVKTSHKDKDGNEIPNYPTEDGEQPKKDIPGYRFVETKKLPNGDIEHVYEKVKTSFKDKDGNEIPNYPTEDGEQPKKDIPGYRFVETKKLPNGDVEHVYEKVTPPAPTPSPVPQPNPGNQNITTWTDENGNPVKPSEPGSKEPGTIPGYEYVKTVTDPNGSIRHIFRKVQTPTPVEPSQPVEPATPAMPEQPAKPQVPATPAQPTAVKEAEGKRELPNTGTEDNASLAALGLLGVLSGFGFVARKKKED